MNEFPDPPPSVSMRLLAWLAVVVATVAPVHSGSVLVYSPSISASHLISNGRIADALARAGHSVVVFVPEYFTALRKFRGPKHPNVTLIQMNDLGTEMDEYLAAGEDIFEHSEFTPISARLGFEDTLHALCRKILIRFHEVRTALAPYKFDVAFSEQLDTCGIGIIRLLGIENHLWISTTALMEANSYRLGVPQPSSYVPTIEENDNSDVLSFWQRAHNLYMYIVAIAIHTYGAEGSQTLFREFAGPSFPHVGEIAANSSLCFVNSDEQFDLPRPSIWKNIFIGGLGIHEPRPLAKDVASIMEKGEKGVILMSFGTIAPFDALPKKTQMDIISVFRRFSSFHFILKVTAEDSTTAALVKDLSNVDLLKWLPQSDMLGHPRLRLFIMHGGLNGLMEAAYRGVPLVVIPFFADQFRNGRLVEKRGMGKAGDSVWRGTTRLFQYILKADLSAETLGSAMEDVLTHPSYKESAMRVSTLLRTRPFSPEERLVKWTEFAMANGVLSHLNVEGSRLNSIVYFNIDVIVVVFALVSFVLFLLLKGICVVKRCIFGSTTPKKLKKN